MNIDHSNCLHIKYIPPFIGNRVYNHSKSDIEKSFELINKERLFKSGFGYSSKNQDKEEYKKLIDDVVIKEYEEMKENILSNSLIEPVLVVSYYKTKKENDTLYIIDEKNGLHKLPINRVNLKSVADFFYDDDIISLVFSSLGAKYDNYIKTLSENNEYKKYYFYHVLGSYLTDTFQDILQEYIKSPFNLETDNKTQRYSFGYKALESLDGNKIIYNLLNLKDHNIKLSNSFMFEPELSTAAIVSFCKYAHYFAN